MYRVAVCDDESAARQDLCGMCAQALTGLETEHEIVPFPSAQALSAALNAGEHFDLLCLDICMDGKTGMELAHELRSRDDQTSILFISGSDAFLREGYEVRPIQYLAKPVDPEDLEQILRTDLRLNHQPRLVTLRQGGRTVVVPVADILYVESREHGIYLKTRSEERFFPISLTAAELLLPRDQFCRCHHSYLVNMASIVEISRRWVVLDNDTEIPIGRRFYESAQSQFVRYLNQNR